MKFQYNITGILKVAAVLIIGAVAFQGFSQSEGMSVCEARENQEEKEVERFIREYYRSLSKDSLTSLEDYITDEEALDEEMLCKKVLLEYGFVRHDVTDVVVYPLSYDTYWLIFVKSEMIVEDLDVTLPGARTFLVGRDKDGNLYMDDNSSDDLEQDLIQEIYEIVYSDEMTDRNCEVAVKYNDIIAEHSEAAQWVQEVSDAQTEVLSEMYAKREYKESAESEKEDYIVKKGDCLWSIAEQELGEGMYWGQIYKTNQAAIGEDPDLLYVGIKLNLDKAAE